jgi:hemolysin activation/secretion protein
MRPDAATTRAHGETGLAIMKRLTQRWVALPCAVAGALLTTAAAAQALPGFERPGEDRRRPPAELKEETRPRLVLPPTPPGGPGDLLSSGMRVRLEKFRFEGNTMFSDAELGALVSRFENREVGNSEIEEARLAITRHYVNAGYINSGAIVPDQQVVGGIITIRVIEGRLTAIEVPGQHGFRPDYLTSRIGPEPTRPLNVVELQDNLQLLLQNPQIERINAELGPGTQPGESILRANVTEAKRYRLGLSLANNRPPSVGPVRAEIHGAANNLLGISDALALRLGKTRGLEDAALSYSVPITRRDTALTLRWDKNNSAVVEEPFRSIDITGRSETFEVALSHPFYRTLQREFSVGMALVKRSSETFLLGEPFSFSPGVTNGSSRVSALRLSAQWIDRTADSVLALRGVLSRGLDAFDATIHHDGTPDSRFVTALAQAQWVKRLPAERGEVLARAEAQKTGGVLLPLEKYAVGGAESVRGYRENLFVRDNGWSGSVEYRLNIARVMVRELGDGPNDGHVKLAFFSDAGRAWDGDGAAGAAKTIYSVGIGIRWDITADAYVHIYKGFALRDVDVRDRDLQDAGVHFRLGMQKRF